MWRKQTSLNPQDRIFLRNHWVQDPDVWNTNWEGPWSLKTCMRKHLSNYRVVAFILNFLDQKKYTVTFYEMKTFFIWKGCMRYQVIVVLYWFRTFYLTDSSKECTKNSFSSRNQFLGFSIDKIVFWQKLFLGQSL
jgi:hypothetical protein